MPSSDHTREDIHEQSDIDEASLEADVGNIADPDLIASADVKVLNPIAPGVCCFKGSRGSADPFDGNREVGPISSTG